MANTHEDLLKECKKDWRFRFWWAVARFIFWLGRQWRRMQFKFHWWRGYLHGKITYAFPSIFMWYYEWRNERAPIDCDFECQWIYPCGFVPEADCPVHDA